MSPEIIVIIIFCIMGLMAHGARKHVWMEWVLRVIFAFSFISEIFAVFVAYPRDAQLANAWSYGVTGTMAVVTGMMLSRHCRQFFSHIFTVLNQVVSGQVLIYLIKGRSASPAPAMGLPVNQEVKTVMAVQKPIVSAPAEEGLEGSKKVVTDEFKAAITESAQEASQEQSGKDATAEAPAEGSAVSGSGSEAPSAASGDAQAAEQPAGEKSASAASEAVPVAASARAPLTGMAAVLFADRIFVANSIPHLNGFWIYVTVLGSLLANISPESMKIPSIPFPLPVPIDVLFNYNFLGLVLLAACGAGIFVYRKPKDVMVRLGLVKPTAPQIAIGIGMIFFTALYDYLWSLGTGAGGTSGVGGSLNRYNSGTFQANGAGPSAVLALATGLFAGIGEEVLIRGALQPVFGILPSGILHGALHGQFTHAPILIIQVAGWSTIMGIVRRYTNTTTTIITHAGWNLCLTFLSAYNP